MVTAPAIVLGSKGRGRPSLRSTLFFETSSHFQKVWSFNTFLGGFVVSSCGAVSWSLSFQKSTRKLNDGSRDEVVDIFSKRTPFSMRNFKPKIGMNM